MPKTCMDWSAYELAEAGRVPSPRLLVYREVVEENIRRMRGHLESVVPGSGFRHLAPHLKTHKSVWATRLLLKEGVERVKCTLHELDLALEAGARDVFVAYPLLAHDAERVAKAVAEHPEVRISAQIGCRAHAEHLAGAARRQGVEVECLLDLNVGNNRTGTTPEAAIELARTVEGTSSLGALRIRGLHAYDGHNSSPDPAERDACAVRAMELVAECARSARKAGVAVERIVVGGSPGFLPDLRELVVRHKVDAHVDVSPGTWVYWDSGYDAKMPGLFRIAALLHAQVMDLPAPNLATLNLGHKRWALDQGPATLFSVPGAEVAGVSEEHTVLRLPEDARWQVGGDVYFAPKHVCPTVNLWETFTIVGPGGRVETAAEPVSGRNR